MFRTLLIGCGIVLGMAACSAAASTPAQPDNTPLLSSAEAIGLVKAYLGTKTY